jgi:hypothetical protein
MGINKKIKSHPWFKGKTNSGNRGTKAVSEIIGTILLLSISIALLCVLYIVVLHNATSPMTSDHTSSSQLIATVEEKDVILENRGGISVPMNAKLVFTIGGHEYFALVSDCVVDTNGDGMWSIGERATFTPPSIDSLIGLQVSITIINPDSNSMIMEGLVQEGEQGDQPYVQTLSPYNVWPHSATLKSYYNFIKNGFVPGTFWYQWKRTDDPGWTLVPSVNITLPLSGYQVVTLYNLTANKNYLFEAWIQYKVGNTTINKSGGIKLFTTQIDSMGQWHFDELSGNIAYDSSGQFPPNDGTLKPNWIQGPQRFTADLNHSAKSLSFDGIDDTCEVANSATLSITDEVTIETWVNRSQHCDGLTGTPLQDSLSQFGYYPFGCYDPCVIHVKGSIYAIVSTNESSVGYLATLNITDTGDILENVSSSSCYVDILNFDVACKTPKIIPINGSTDKFAIVYTKTSGGKELYLKTVQIFNDGRIDKTILGTRILDTANSYSPDIININSDVYAVVYSVNATYLGKLLSVNISTTGIISPVNNKLAFVDIMMEPEIIKVIKSTNVYVIVYNCIGDDGGIRTMKISNTGSLSDISGHVWFDTNDGGNPEIINIHNDIYAIIYAGPILRQSGFLKTIEIASDGTITLVTTVPPLAKTIDQFVFEATVGNFIRSPHILALHGMNNFYGISYSIDSPTASLWGKIVTICIQNTGLIVVLSKKDVIFEPFICSTSYFFPLVNDMYGIVYRCDAGDGVLKTIQIGDDGHIHKNPIIDMQELGGIKCYAEDELLTSDKKFVADVFRGIDATLVLKTAAVYTANNTIAHAFTDSFTIELGYTSSNGTFNSSYSPIIIPIYNDVYAVAYCQYLSSPLFHDGKIKTVKIDSTGHITLIDQYTFDSNCMNTAFAFIPINKSTGMYAIAYRIYSTSQGKVMTVRIDNTGHISGTGGSGSYVFESVFCQEPSIVRVYGDVYAVLYRDARTTSLYGKLATLKIWGNGTIKQSVLDVWQFASSCYHPYIVRVANNIFSFVYSQYYGSSGNPYYGWLKTVRIEDTGIINKTFIDSLEFTRRYYTDNLLSHQPEIIYVKDRVYAILYKDLPDPWNAYRYYGWISTVRIGDNGDIVDAVEGSTQISSSPRIFSYDIKIIPFINDSYIALYGGMNSDIYQCVIRIPLSETTQNILSKKDSYAIQANKTMVFASFTDSNSQVYTLSAPLQNNWNYIICTYDKTTMNLYVNANLVGSRPLNGRPMKVTSQKLLFGPYNGVYDEFSIYAALLTPVKIAQNYNYYRPS